MAFLAPLSDERRAILAITVPEAIMLEWLHDSLRTLEYKFTMLNSTDAAKLQLEYIRLTIAKELLHDLLAEFENLKTHKPESP